MMWVRSPCGQCIRYDKATLVRRREAEYVDLYEDDAYTRWVAQVPNSWLIEGQRACSVENPSTHGLEAVRQEITALRKEAASLRRLIAKLRKVQI